MSPPRRHWNLHFSGVFLAVSDNPVQPMAFWVPLRTCTLEVIISGSMHQERGVAVCEEDDVWIRICGEQDIRFTLNLHRYNLPSHLRLIHDAATARTLYHGGLYGILFHPMELARKYSFLFFLREFLVSEDPSLFEIKSWFLISILVDVRRNAWRSGLASGIVYNVAYGVWHVWRMAQRWHRAQIKLRYARKYCKLSSDIDVAIFRNSTLDTISV